MVAPDFGHPPYFKWKSYYYSYTSRWRRRAKKCLGRIAQHTHSDPNVHATHVVAVCWSGFQSRLIQYHLHPAAQYIIAAAVTTVATKHIAATKSAVRSRDDSKDLLAASRMYIFPIRPCDKAQMPNHANEMTNIIDLSNDDIPPTSIPRSLSASLAKFIY